MDEVPRQGMPIIVIGGHRANQDLHDDVDDDEEDEEESSSHLQ